MNTKWNCLTLPPLFTNVPLNDNLDIILQRIYIDIKSDTTIPKREMKDLLYLCTKMRILVLTVRFMLMLKA